MFIVDSIIISVSRGMEYISMGSGGSLYIRPLKYSKQIGKCLHRNIAQYGMSTYSVVDQLETALGLLND